MPMKRYALIVSLLFFASLLTGCDFLRKVALRPLSAEIAQIRDSIERCDAIEAERLRAEKEAAEALAKAAADSVSAMELFANEEVAMVPAKSVRGVSFEGFDSRYCIITGVFSDPANAAAMTANIERAGAEPVTFRYRSGKVLVGAAPSATLGEIGNAYRRLSKESFFPAGAWILVNEPSL